MTELGSHEDAATSVQVSDDGAIVVDKTVRIFKNWS